MAVEKAVGVVVTRCWGDPFAQRTLIALNEKDISYELVEVIPGHEKIIFVLHHNGKAVHGSLNAVENIDEAFPDTRSLLPSDAYERAQARFWADYVDKMVPICGFRLLNLDDGDALTQARGEMVEIFETLERELGDKEFFGGEHGFGFVDAAFAPYTSSFLSYERYGEFKLEDVAPRIAAWWKRVEDTESVIKSWL